MHDVVWNQLIISMYYSLFEKECNSSNEFVFRPSWIIYLFIYYTSHNLLRINKKMH